MVATVLDTAVGDATALEAEARPRPTSDADRAAWAIAATVCDPEVPVLTIEDLGVLRRVSVADGSVAVEITPTYSGCPAVDAMRDDIVTALTAAGYAGVTVTVVLAPAWTTDWLSDAGRAKLEQYGIAAPAPRQSGGKVSLGLGIRCPHCGSLHTRELSRFGSTSCKALYVCQRCQEPFDYFKEH
ncbi:phenylacetate-CoA oxygenase subunit PaaJ [Leifsonia kafniensis]|uniref:Phenylacetate-CoA oxygenase subunit PaaJ n=1 Tax=Leifsonia kafniensis TaxID=475957 RepID=A0ABP7L1D8_9MICO